MLVKPHENTVIWQNSNIKLNQIGYQSWLLVFCGVVMFKITDLRLSSCPQVLNQRSSQRGSCTPRRRQRGGRDRLRWARRQRWVRPNVRGGESALQSLLDCLLIFFKLYGWSVITEDHLRVKSLRHCHGWRLVYILCWKDTVTVKPPILSWEEGGMKRLLGEERGESISY